MRVAHVNRPLDRLQTKGKPLLLSDRNFSPVFHLLWVTLDFDMNRLFAFFLRVLPARRTPVPGVARQLMERAGDRAGRNPRQARELRRAAFAYLSVVR
jgi:hypothetical protein